MMQTLDANRWAIFRRVEFPGALPSIFSGMRIAATFAAIGAIFGEWAGASAGLGYVILQATPNLQTARIFAAIVILTLIAMALFATGVAAGADLRPLGAEGGRRCRGAERRSWGGTAAWKAPRAGARKDGADGSESQDVLRRRRAGVRRHRRGGVQQLRRTTVGTRLRRRSTSGATGSAAPVPASLTVELDWVPNPDHVGLYYAQDKGYFSRRGPDGRASGLRPTPPIRSSSSASTRWTSRSRTSPRCSTASRTTCRSMAVATVVPVPLNSMIVAPGETVTVARQISGKSVGVTGIPSDDAFYTTMLKTAGLTEGDVDEGERRVQPRALAPVEQGRRDHRRIPQRRSDPDRAGDRHEADRLPGGRAGRAQLRRAGGRGELGPPASPTPRTRTP